MFGDDLLGDPQNIEEIVEEEEALYLEPNENEDAAGVNEGDDDEETSPALPGAGEKATEPKKKRTVQRPQPKLNPERLMGPRGIATLETVFKDFKFLGKGNEENDLDQVMKHLEMWAHRLYPRFQFDDCLEKIESLGHKKPVMTYVKKIRMGMVTADDPQHLVEEIEDDNEPALDDQPPIDEFDALISQQLSHIQTNSPVPAAQTQSLSSSTLSAEQRERMLRNRLLAEERRLARMKAQKDKDMEVSEATSHEKDMEISEATSHPEKEKDMQLSEATSHPDKEKDMQLSEAANHPEKEKDIQIFEATSHPEKEEDMEVSEAPSHPEKEKDMEVSDTTSYLEKGTEVSEAASHPEKGKDMEVSEAASRPEKEEDMEVSEAPCHPEKEKDMEVSDTTSYLEKGTEVSETSHPEKGKDTEVSEAASHPEKKKDMEFSEATSHPDTSVNSEELSHAADVERDQESSLRSSSDQIYNT